MASETNDEDFDFGDIDIDGAERVGIKVIEMAERVKVMDLACPGAVARWGFELDDVEYDVSVKVRKPQ